MDSKLLHRASVAILGVLGVVVTLSFPLGGSPGLDRHLLQILLPLILALGLCVFGSWLVREEVPTAVVWTTARSMLVGAGLFAFIVFWLVTILRTAGAGLSNRGISYLNAVLFGLALFAVIGYLYGQLRARTARLRRQRTQLRQQTERLDEFASLVSHDLRNPLAVAQGHLELATDAANPSEHHEKASTALDRMEELLTEMLTLARHGQVIEATTPVKISSVARTAWGYVQAPDAQLEVEDDLVVQADATRLEQVFENLFRNAIEHGGPDVLVRVGALHTTGFYVEDEGPGLSPALRDDVFGMGVSTDEQGTGYGLAIVKAIVEAHGWSITAQEEATGGARFEIAV